jgi:hypothetical protein
MKIKSPLFGEIELNNKTPDYFSYEDLEGYYVIFLPKTLFSSADYVSVSKIRFDKNKQEYVLDVCGQDDKYSEELRRYNNGKWWFSDKIL